MNEPTTEASTREHLERIFEQFPSKPTESGRYAEGGYNDHFNDGASEALDWAVQALIEAGVRLSDQDTTDGLPDTEQTVRHRDTPWCDGASGGLRDALIDALLVTDLISGYDWLGTGSRYPTDDEIRAEVGEMADAILPIIERRETEAAQRGVDSVRHGYDEIKQSRQDLHEQFTTVATRSAVTSLRAAADDWRDAEGGWVTPAGATTTPQGVHEWLTARAARIQNGEST